MGNKDIIIWTEGGKGIGLGHVRRCLVIAEELRERGINSCFYINDDPTATGWIKKEGFLYKISSFSEPQLFNTAVTHKSLILIDTKKPIAELIRSLKKKGYKIILMDNITNARLEADIVIYPTAIFENNLNWGGFNGKLFIGTDYVPIAETYIRARQKAKLVKLEPPYQVLVTMGGSDPNNLSYKVVSSLLELTESDLLPVTHHQIPIKIKLIMGPAFSPDTRLNEIEKQKFPNVKFIGNIEDLSLIMAESHIAITALGTTIFELACLGVPAIIIANYRTDETDMNAFKKLGICLPLGYYEDVSDGAVKQAVKTLLKDGKLWSDMSQKGRMIIDGKGAERIAAIVKKLLLENFGELTI